MWNLHRKKLRFGKWAAERFFHSFAFIRDDDSWGICSLFDQYPKNLVVISRPFLIYKARRHSPYFVMIIVKHQVDEKEPIVVGLVSRIQQISSSVFPSSKIDVCETQNEKGIEYSDSILQTSTVGPDSSSTRLSTPSRPPVFSKSPHMPSANLFGGPWMQSDLCRCSWWSVLRAK